MNEAWNSGSSMALQEGMSSGFAFKFPWPCRRPESRGRPPEGQELSGAPSALRPQGHSKSKAKSQTTHQVQTARAWALPQSLGPTEEARAGPSSSMASKLWLGLSVRHKRQVGKTPPQAGVRAGPNSHASSLTPESLSRAHSPSLFQAPTGDGDPSSYGNPRPSLLPGLAQQEKRPREREVTGDHRKERSPG